MGSELKQRITNEAFRQRVCLKNQQNFRSYL